LWLAVAAVLGLHHHRLAAAVVAVAAIWQVLLSWLFQIHTRLWLVLEVLVHPLMKILVFKGQTPRFLGLLLLVAAVEGAQVTQAV